MRSVLWRPELETIPSDNALKELKQSHNFDGERRMALTVPEQKLFSSYLEQTPQYHHWKLIFTVMMEAGLRVGEATGVRWEDVDIENGCTLVNDVRPNKQKNGSSEVGISCKSFTAVWPR